MNAQTTTPNTRAALDAAAMRIRRMTAADLQAELLNERLAAGLPTDDALFFKVDGGMQDPGPDYTPRAWG